MIPEATTAPIEGETLVRKNAERDSAECQYCHGSGWAMIYHPAATGGPTVDVRGPGGEITQVAARSSAFCVCAMGELVTTCAKGSAPAIYERTVKLDDVLKGKHPWRAIDPRRVRDPTPPAPGERVPWQKLVEQLGGRIHVRRDPPKRQPWPATPPVPDDDGPLF